MAGSVDIPGSKQERTDCTVPYLHLDRSDADLIRYGQAIQFAPDFISAIRWVVTEELNAQRAKDAELLDPPSDGVCTASNNNARNCSTPTSPKPSPWPTSKPDKTLLERTNELRSHS